MPMMAFKTAFMPLYSGVKNELAPSEMKFFADVKKFLIVVNPFDTASVTFATTSIKAVITPAMPEIAPLINVPMIGATVSRKNPANA